MIRKKRFSLVELIVVLTILAMLSSVLVPSLIRSRQQAMKTSCLSNLKQLGIATKLYVQEQGFYPDAYKKLSGSLVKYWCYEYDGNFANFAGGAMADYIQDRNVLKCPSFSDYKAMDLNKEFTSSYGINAEYVGGDPNVVSGDLDAILNSEPARPEEIRRPELTVMFGDSARINGRLAETWLLWARYSYAFGIDLDATSHFRHNSRSVVVFCDGHCEDDLKPDAVFSWDEKVGWLSRDIMERK